MLTTVHFPIKLGCPLHSSILHYLFTQLTFLLVYHHINGLASVPPLNHLRPTPPQINHAANIAEKGVPLLEPLVGLGRENVPVRDELMRVCPPRRERAMTRSGQDLAPT